MMNSSSYDKFTPPKDWVKMKPNLTQIFLFTLPKTNQAKASTIVY